MKTQKIQKDPNQTYIDKHSKVFNEKYTEWGLTVNQKLQKKIVYMRTGNEDK